MYSRVILDMGSPIGSAGLSVSNRIVVGPLKNRGRGRDGDSSDVHPPENPA